MRKAKLGESHPVAQQFQESIRTMTPPSDGLRPHWLNIQPLQGMANNGDHEMSQSESVSSTSYLGVYVRE